MQLINDCDLVMILEDLFYLFSSLKTLPRICGINITTISHSNLDKPIWLHPNPHITVLQLQIYNSFAYIKTAIQTEIVKI